MTDETFKAVVERAREVYVPPMAGFPVPPGAKPINALRIIVDDAKTEPELDGGDCYLSQADYADLQARCAAWE